MSARPTLLRGCILAGVASALVVASRSRPASASPDLLLDGATTHLSGTVRYRVVHLTHGAKIQVVPYDGDPARGRLEIIAHSIIVDATSSIDATGAGFRGRQDDDGEGPGGGTGAKTSDDSAAGGGYGGKGGPGVFRPSCLVNQATKGGDPYETVLEDIRMGSAGSAAGSHDGDPGGRGGNGGGAIVLRAGRIALDGIVVADGLAGAVFDGDDSSGGGAGGGILLHAGQLVSVGAARLQVNGASGGKSAKDEGGAGGGGRIRLFVPTVPPSLVTSVQGGASACDTAKGASGSVMAPKDLGCPDLDGDGPTSSECGGKDCDDSDPEVRPGAAERCNGEDDDCNGAIDDGDLRSVCGGGSCVNGVCVPEPDAGPPDAPPEASADSADAPEPAEDSGPPAPDAPPDAGDADAPAPVVPAVTFQPVESVVLRGGCAIGAPASPSRSAPLGAASGAALLLMVAACRSRRGPRAAARRWNGPRRG
jgi:hypothetical protein